MLIILQVDDGTSVIDCLHRRERPQSSPGQRGSSKVEPPVTAAPKPIASLGSTVRLIGKVVSKHDSRQIKIDQIGSSSGSSMGASPDRGNCHSELCTSSNDQPVHWKNVVSLHRSLYSGPEPFAIPTAVARDAPPAVVVPQGQVPSESVRIADVTADRPRTPPTRFSTPSTSTVSSPAKSISAPQACIPPPFSPLRRSNGHIPHYSPLTDSVTPLASTSATSRQTHSGSISNITWITHHQTSQRFGHLIFSQNVSLLPRQDRPLACLPTTPQHPPNDHVIRISLLTTALHGPLADLSLNFNTQITQ